MSELVVRVYNVLFGDAILIKVPDRDHRTGTETLRHILIDVGNVSASRGGREDVFAPIVRNIQRELVNSPVDLYVMTHEHLDHVGGLYAAATKHGLALKVDYAWLTASAAGEPYYRRYDGARRRKLSLERAYERAALRLRGMRAAWPRLAATVQNNSRKLTGRCVGYLQKLAPARQTSYVHRGYDRALHPFREAQFRILAPEADVSVYYGRVRQPVGAGRVKLVPPRGVDARAFRRLVSRWRDGAIETMLAIDRAANNTSIVFELRWRGWKLLFTGDAELKSWSLMKDKLRPVHFLKVGHHGSHNATPGEFVLDKILPRRESGKRARVAVVSTCAQTYPGVPDAHATQKLKARCDKVLLTSAESPGGYVDIIFCDSGTCYYSRSGARRSVLHRA